MKQHSYRTFLSRLQALLLPLLLLQACTSENIALGTAERTEKKSTTATPPVSQENTTGQQPLAQQGRIECDSLKAGPPRGLSCLHCTQPEARAQAEQIKNVLLASCLQNIAVTYLVDGTFGFDEVYLIDQITALTESGRRPFITFYLANGAAQRRHDTTVIESFATRISPEEFRNRIQHDPYLQGEYQQIVDRIVPVLRYATQRGAVVAVIPVLEDNLSNKAFEAMAELTLAVIPSDISVALGRNPCSGCYPGNEDKIPAGTFHDLHISHPHFDIIGGMVSNDGRNYSSRAAPRYNADTTLDNLRAVRDAAARGDNVFILWSAERQGLPDANGEHPSPSGRLYAGISPLERQEIIEFLRE